MYVLGIETSCDETAAALVCNGKKVLSNIISSTLAQHRKYGGVIPEIAARGHIQAIDLVVARAVKEAKIDFKKIGLIAVTAQPGLPGALLVGNVFAKVLGFALDLPLLEIDHTLAHLYAPFLDPDSRRRAAKFPFVGLAVSGGHTSLIFFKTFKQFKILGQTLDDAAGEAFDKVAKILNLPYPGGPEIERLARLQLKPKLRFNCARLKNTFDFSFSGIKTSVLYFVRDWEKNRKRPRVMPIKLKAEIASAFQLAVVEVLVEKSIAACKEKKVKDLVIGGGVAVNLKLRASMILKAESEGIKVHFAKIPYCLDNAAMVAGLAYQMLP